MTYKAGDFVEREIAGVIREVVIVRQVSDNEYRVINPETEVRSVIKSEDIIGYVS